MHYSIDRYLHRSIMIILFTGVTLSSAMIVAEVEVADVFGDNMVLQRDQSIPVWGKANPGESIAITLDGNERSTSTDESGNWKIHLPAMKAGGPYELRVKGMNSVVFENVLVGEVWICSGQSNMEWRISSTRNAKQVIQKAHNPQIRLFTIPHRPSGLPLSDLDVSWVECDSQSVKEFSAVGYFFGFELQQSLDVPIGLINTTWGGTRIEPWTPSGGFADIPELEEINNLINQSNRDYLDALENLLPKWSTWLTQASMTGSTTSVPVPPEALPDHALANRQQPTALYNGMVHAIAPYAIRGAIWYQGEANRREGLEYYHKMQALIQGWRKVWEQGDFPFYFVQLAPFRYNENPYNLPKIWEAQRQALLIPNTGMAVTVDVGNLNNIHPTNKQTVGHRLALWARAEVYGENELIYSGPLYKSMRIRKSEIILTFDHIAEGLTTRDARPLVWFEIAGSDKIFYPAQAMLQGKTVIVSSNQVANPVMVRYGWHQEAEPNLMNSAGLPASPFHTDLQ